MSGLDGLQLDADGYLDLEVHGVGPDLTDDEVLDLRDALHADPVDEPTADEWAALVDGAIDAEPTADGPFVVDDVAFADGAHDLGGSDPAADVDVDLGADEDGDATDADAADADADATDPTDAPVDAEPSSTDAEVWALDEGDVDLDLVELDGGDDLFPDDGGGDALPEVVPDIEDLL